MFKSTSSKRKSTAGARRAPSAQASKRRLQLQALEPRVLLDAAAAATAEHVMEQAHQAAPEQQPADADVGAALAQVDQMAAPVSPDDSQDAPATQSAPLGSPSLLATSFAPTVNPGSSLLVDGSFEASGTWTQESGASAERGTAQNYGVGAIEGVSVTEVEGAVGTSYIEQTVDNLVAGQTYTLSWYAHTRTSSSYATKYGTGVDLGRTIVIGAEGGDVSYDYATSRTEWQRHTVTFTASESGSVTIRFASRGNTTGSTANDGGGLILDAARLDVDKYVTHYTENEAGVAVVAPDALITDLDSANLQSLTVKISNGQAGDVLALGASLPAGIAASYDANTFTLTLSGLASRDAYLAALKAVQFSSTSDTISTVDRNISISTSDGVNTSSPATTVMQVSAVNDAPLPVDVTDVPGLSFDAATGEYTMTAQEDAAFAGRVAASDADGDLVSFSAGTRPANGTLVVNPDGSYSYTPASDFAGTDSFTLLADDGHGGVTSIKVNVVVAQVNDAPVAKGVVYDTPEDVTLTLDLLANDSDVEDGKPVIDSINGTALTGGPQIIDVPGGQVVIGVGGVMQFVPAVDVSGSFSFDYTVKDSAGALATAQVTIQVGALPDAPTPSVPAIAVPGQAFDEVTGEYTLTAPEDAPFAGQVFATDPDGDPVIFSEGTRPANGTLVVNPDGTYSYTPADNFAGTDSFTILADDGQGGVTPITVNVVVNAVNDGPVAKGVSVDTPEDTRVTLDLLVNDSDVEDGKPSLASINGTALTGGEQIIDVPGGQLFIGIDGKIDFLPAADVNGAVSFDYTVTDSLGALASATVTINVIPVNDAARVVDPGIAGQVFDAATATVTVTVLEDTPVDGRIAVLDPEGDLLNFTVDTPPAHGTVVINLDGTYTYVPDADYNGQDSFVVMVDDGQGNLTPATVIVEIGATQDAPRPVDPQIPGQDFDPDTGITTVTANEGQPVDGAFGVVDPDGDALVITVDTPPAHGALVINPDGTYTYTPEPGFSGEDSFVVMADDGNGNLTPVVIELNVLPEAPQLVDPQLPNQSFDAVTGTITVNAIEDLPVEGRIDALDLQGDLLNFTVDTPPAHGTVVINLDGSYTYTPDPDFNGEDSFIIMVDDGKGNLTPATVVVAIGATQDAPRLVDPQIPGQDFDPATGITTVTANEGQPVDGAFGVVDPDGDALVITVDTPPAHGVLVINPDGTYNYTPEPGFSGEDSFVVIADDGNGNLTPIVIELNVLPEAPQLLDPGIDGQVFDPATGTTTVTATEDMPVDGRIVAEDLQGDELHFTVDTEPAHGTLVINPDGTYTYTPDPDFNGEDSFVVIVDDGKGNLTPATVVIDIAATEDAPRLVDPQIPGQSFDPATGITTVTADEGQPVDGEFGVVDPDGDGLSFTVDTEPAHGALVINPDGTYSYTPEPGFSGEDSFVVIADDGKGNLTPIVIELNVQPETPQLVDPQLPDQSFDPATGTTTVTATEDVPVDGCIAAEDLQGDELHFTVDTEPAHGTLVINPDGTYTYTPDPDFNGEDSFVVIVDDGKGNLTPATVVIDIAAAEDAPRLVDPQIPGQSFDPATGTTTANSENGAPVDGSIGVVDPDGGGLSYTVDTQPEHGTLVINPDGTYTYTPEPGFSGKDSFVVMVDDGTGNLTPATVVINCVSQDSNDVPFYQGDAAQSGEQGGGAGTNANRDSGDGGISSGQIEAGSLGEMIDELDPLNGIAGMTTRKGDMRTADGARSGVEKVLASMASNAQNDRWTSARLDDVFVEMEVHGDQVWLSFHSDATKVDVSGADGKTLPSWMHVPGNGQVVIDRPADVEVVRVRLKVQHAGDAKPHGMLVEINLNTGEVRVVERQGGKASHHAPAERHASATFSAQVARTAQAAPADAELMRLLG